DEFPTIQPDFAEDFTMFGTHRRQISDRRVISRRPAVEALESRELLSWSSAPPAQLNLYAQSAARYTINSFGSNGNFFTYNAVKHNEVDEYWFTAQRTGTYQFTTAINTISGPKIDTVAALFDTNGKRLAYNDDAFFGTTNSHFTYFLHAGWTYVFGITNYQ